MKELVAHVPSDTILVPLGLNRDQNGANFYAPDMVRFLSEAANAPMYCLSGYLRAPGRWEGHS